MATSLNDMIVDQIEQIRTALNNGAYGIAYSMIDVLEGMMKENYLNDKQEIYTKLKQKIQYSKQRPLSSSRVANEKLKAYNDFYVYLLQAAIKQKILKTGTFK